MAIFKRSRWKPGTVCAVPLEDGSFGLAQAISTMGSEETEEVENIVHVALFSEKFTDIPTVAPKLDAQKIISHSSTWRSDLNNGSWHKVSVEPLVARRQDFPNEKYANDGFIGAVHSDIGLLEDFLSAFHGLVPWNIMFEEDCWDQYLSEGVQRPDTANVLSKEEREKYREQNP